MQGKRYLVFSIFFLLTAFIFDGQVIGKEGSSSLEKYKWALQFGIRRDLTLGSFESGAISFKRQMSPKSALRFGISLTYSYKNRYDKNHDYWSEFSVIYQRYINPTSRAKFYWGIGPYIHLSYDYTLDSRDDSYNETISKGYGIGILCIGGIEWFATSVISFHAEYRADATYLWGKYKRESKQPGEDPKIYESAYDSFHILNNTVLFGISVYF